MAFSHGDRLGFERTIRTEVDMDLIADRISDALRCLKHNLEDQRYQTNNLVSSFGVIFRALDETIQDIEQRAPK